MEGLLQEVSSTRNQHDARPDAFVIRQASQPPRSTTLEGEDGRQAQKREAVSQQGTALEAALDEIRSAADIESLRACLRSISRDIILQLPGPSQARIVKIWIDIVLPNFWQISSGDHSTTLCSPLRNLTGINALLAQLRLSIGKAAFRDTKNDERRIVELLQVLQHILSTGELVSDLWRGLQPLISQPIKHELAWKEIVNLLGSGKIVAVQSEAFDQIKGDYASKSVQPLSGQAYAAWLARSTVLLLINDQDDVEAVRSKATAQLLSKAFSLGYSNDIVKELIVGVLQHVCIDENSDTMILHTLLQSFNAQARTRFIEATLSWLSTLTAEDIVTTPVLISHIAALLQTVIKDDTTTYESLASMLTDAAVTSRWSPEVRRAMILTLESKASTLLGRAFDKALSLFGEQLFIDHTPMFQQESMLQVLLLQAGCVRLSGLSRLHTSTQAAKYTTGVSNRLASSSARARWLGMILATAVSELQDDQASRMNFHISDMETDEAKEYLNFIHIHDQIGNLSGFAAIVKEETQIKRKPKRKIPLEKLPIINGKQSFGPPRPPQMVQPQARQTEIKGDRIAELSDDDDDLIPYAKPDSDPEDSDEDATLVNRNKPRPPVYIRTLMSMLRDTEKPDRFQLGIKHAGPLIRRKIGFGREVSDHAEELARILTNLQDPFETPDFDELRLQALIALIISDVDDIAPWLARQAFENGYSIAQRCIMLTALGLCGREMAGHKHEDRLNPALNGTDFPSKRLPARLNAIYGQSGRAVHMLEEASRAVESAVIQPMALQAADKTTSSLDAVKVRTFSSRLEVERTKRKPMANALAKVFSKDFFYPLLNRLQQDIAAFGDTSICVSTPMVLSTLLKTITILLHAAGPATVDLPQIRTAYWDILLFLRTKATGDVMVMEALLFSLLTLLDTGTDKQQLVQDNPRELMEMKQWAEMVFEKLNGGNLVSEGQSEEDRITALCAGVITKINDIIQDYQQLLMGSWSDV